MRNIFVIATLLGLSIMGLTACSKGEEASSAPEQDSQTTAMLNPPAETQTLPAQPGTDATAIDAQTVATKAADTTIAMNGDNTANTTNNMSGNTANAPASTSNQSTDATAPSANADMPAQNNDDANTAKTQDKKDTMQDNGMMMDSTTSTDAAASSTSMAQ